MLARSALLLLVLPLLVAAQVAAPAEQPRIEFGVGGLAMVLPDYSGSNRYGSRLLPFPYLVYRTERVQLTREGLRAKLFAADRITASLSAAVNLTGRRDNPDRAGMPRLAPTFEAGPSLDFLLTDPGPLRLRLRLPVRAVAAVNNLEFRDVGWVAVPHLRIDYTQAGGQVEWSHAMSVGPTWVSEDYSEYFYGVAAQYATPTRPAYDAKAGYGGSGFTLSSVMRRGRWRFGLFGSYDWLKGAVFDDSPLVRSQYSAVGGLFITCRLYASGIGEPLEDETP